MCDPVTLTGIALTAGSTVINTMANSKAEAARKDALAAERIRQQGYDQEAAALNTQSQDRYTDFGGQQEAKAKDLGDYFAGQQIANTANAGEQASAVMPAATSDITVAEEAKQKAKARAFTDKQGEALGNLRAFGDVLGGIGRLQARDASQIGQIGGFKKGSSDVLKYELDAANHAGDGMKLFGDLLSLGGGAATSAGLSGKSFGNLFGSTPSVVTPANTASMATARALDRASVPGYSGYNLYGR